MASELLERTERGDRDRLAAAERDYAELLARHNAPLPDDPERLRATLGVLDRTTNDFAADAKALDDARAAWPQVIEPDAAQRLADVRKNVDDALAEKSRELAADIFRDLPRVAALEALSLLIGGLGKIHGFGKVATAEARFNEIAAAFQEVGRRVGGAAVAADGAAGVLRRVQNQNPRAYAIASAEAGGRLLPMTTNREAAAA